MTDVLFVGVKYENFTAIRSPFKLFFSVMVVCGCLGGGVRGVLGDGLGWSGSGVGVGWFRCLLTHSPIQSLT